MPSSPPLPSCLQLFNLTDTEFNSTNSRDPWMNGYKMLNPQLSRSLPFWMLRIIRASYTWSHRQCSQPDFSDLCFSLPGKGDLWVDRFPSGRVSWKVSRLLRVEVSGRHVCPCLCWKWHPEDTPFWCHFFTTEEIKESDVLSSSSFSTSLGVQQSLQEAWLETKSLVQGVPGRKDLEKSETEEGASVGSSPTTEFLQKQQLLRF